ncbi:PRC-barrel domain containing protein [Bradyrhizobium sp. STM 3562]|uniref:PRC-barrel domain containing protein n=1 Tax=Bradyrhizobium sp. STM 3562 TaxID=578924 RepID=UPI00388F19C2
MSESSTGEKRAINILRELHAAEEELVGRVVVMTDGKAGAIDHIYLDDVHGLRISISGHDGQWPISTVKFIRS